jgi:hypothetical protein
VSGKVNGNCSEERLMSDFYFSSVELKFLLPGFRAVVYYIWSVYSVEKCLRGKYFISLNVNTSGQCFDLCW